MVLTDCRISLSWVPINHLNGPKHIYYTSNTRFYSVFLNPTTIPQLWCNAGNSSSVCSNTKLSIKTAIVPLLLGVIACWFGEM